MLIAKIVRQAQPNRFASTRKPARIGPPTADRPMIGPNAPKAAAISSGGNISLISPSPCGSIIAPNRPCSTRAVISIVGDCDTAQSSEKAAKPPAPTVKIWALP